MPKMMPPDFDPEWSPVSEEIVVFNINGDLKGDEERCVFLGEGRLCWYDSGVIH